MEGPAKGGRYEEKLGWRFTVELSILGRFADRVYSSSLLLASSSVRSIGFAADESWDRDIEGFKQGKRSLIHDILLISNYKFFGLSQLS